MPEPKMKDKCGNCGKQYAKHALFGDWCPAKPREPFKFAATKFKRMRRKRGAVIDGRKNESM